MSVTSINNLCAQNQMNLYIIYILLHERAGDPPEDSFLMLDTYFRGSKRWV